MKRFARIDDIAMRVGLVGECVDEATAADAVAMIEATYHAAARGDADGQRVLLALGWALLDPGRRQRRVELGIEARERELHRIVDILLPGEPGSRDEAPRLVPDFGRGRPLTLG